MTENSKAQPITSASVKQLKKDQLAPGSSEGRSQCGA